MAAASRLARYGAMESALCERRAPSRLHHHRGHDPQDAGRPLRLCVFAVAKQASSCFRSDRFRPTRSFVRRSDDFLACGEKARATTVQ
jgi:hypothetical protein